jgi:biotin transport system ATP-binding protein
MIELRQVSHWFGDRPILRDINLILTEPRIGVIGSNGSGKSTLARLLNGLLLPTQGQVLVEELDTRREGKRIRRRVGFVFQNPDHQIVLPTVAEDLAFGLKPLKLTPAEIAQRVEAVLHRYHLADLRDQSAHLLSGGQKQLLAIAAVLVTEPRYIVFDEPTTLLDLRNRRQIQRVLQTLPQSLVVVTHDLDLLVDFDRVLVFDKGRVVMDGPPKDAIAFYEAQMACL